MVFALAVEQQRLLITLDTDFGELLARSEGTAPSVLLIRRRDHRAEAITAVVIDVLVSSGQTLLDGALAVAGERTVRLRELPLTT